MCGPNASCAPAAGEPLQATVDRLASSCRDVANQIARTWQICMPQPPHGNARPSNSNTPAPAPNSTVPPAAAAPAPPMGPAAAVAEAGHVAVGAVPLEPGVPSGNGQSSEEHAAGQAGAHGSCMPPAEPRQGLGSMPSAGCAACLLVLCYESCMLLCAICKIAGIVGIWLNLKTSLSVSPAACPLPACLGLLRRSLTSCKLDLPAYLTCACYSAFRLWLRRPNLPSPRPGSPHSPTPRGKALPLVSSCWQLIKILKALLLLGPAPRSSWQSC